jgi:Lipocalin-like domain
MASIVGTWKMAGAVARDRNGKLLPPPYGGKGMGRVAFTVEGRMMAVTCDGRTELSPGRAGPTTPTVATTRATVRGS